MTQHTSAGATPVYLIAVAVKIYHGKVWVVLGSIPKAPGRLNVKFILVHLLCRGLGSYVWSTYATPGVRSTEGRALAKC